MKVPEPRKLKSGTWFIQLRLGGVSIPVTAGSEKEVCRQATLIKAEYMAGHRPLRKSDCSIGDLVDAYIKKYRPVLSPSTVRGYAYVRRCRLPSIMELRPQDVRDWQGVVSRELETCSVKTVKNAWGVITAVFRDAKIPVPEIKMPRAPERDLAYLQPEEIPPFLESARGDSMELGMLLELHSLRESEALQVLRHPEQIDLDARLIRVRGALVRSDGEAFVEKMLNKSRAGTRLIPIMIPRLEELVRAYRDAGEPLPQLNATTLLRHVHAVCARAGVTDVTNHDLRRSFASLCYSRGISERLIAEWGGWDDPATMHRIYIKLARRDKEQASARMRDFYAPKDRLQEALERLRALQTDYADVPELRPVFAAADAIEKGKMLTENANGSGSA